MTILLIGVVIVLIAAILYLTMQQDNQPVFPKQFQPHELPNLKRSYLEPSVFTWGLEDLDIQETDLQNVKEELGKRVIGMNDFVHSILVNLLVGGHMLVEWVPGLAKTRTIHTLAQVLDLDFARIQFTPDMLPSDIIGVELYNMNKKEFETKIGPVMTNLLLADEINRTTPKVQSALLEAMQEQQVTVSSKTHALPEPFFVMATQNPLEQEGTYPLPEAQLDRFLFKVLVWYPTHEEEMQILEMMNNQNLEPLKKVLTKSKFTKLKQQVNQVQVGEEIKDYIIRLVSSTRESHPHLAYGASPRASIALLTASKAVAFLEGREFVTHHDVHRLALAVMRHRIGLTYEAITEGQTPDSVLINILKEITLE